MANAYKNEAGDVLSVIPQQVLVVMFYKVQNWHTYTWTTPEDLGCLVLEIDLIKG